MTESEIRDAVVRALQRVAPELDPATLAGDAPLRAQLDIDSVDFLRVLGQLHETLGVDIPETDYARVATLDGCVAYLRERLAQGAAPGPGRR